jgi:threonine/homoserine/homoserine lactone efflux protein
MFHRASKSSDRGSLVRNVPTTATFWKIAGRTRETFIKERANDGRIGRWPHRQHLSSAIYSSGPEFLLLAAPGLRICDAMAAAGRRRLPRLGCGGNRRELSRMAIVIPGAASIGLFGAAALLLLLTPGPAVLYIVARSVAQGRLAGLVSVCGITTGTLVHVLAAALGLSALLASSALAFGVVKYAGTGYLIYIGARRILSRSDAPAASVEQPRRSLGRLYRDGFVVNLLNPKTALFFLAFLPQFVDPSRGGAASQIVFLGLLFALMGLISDGLYALAAGAAGRWVRGNGRALRWERYVTGGVFIGLGVSAAIAGNGQK